MTTQPKKYEIITAVEWDVDIQFNTALANKVGDGCIEFLGTSPGDDSEIQYTNFIPVEAGAPYSIFGWIQGNNAASNATVGVRWYDDDQVFDSAVAGFTGAVPSANVWHRLGGILNAPAAARYAKPYFKKDEDAHKTYLDDLAFAAMPITAHSYRNANQANVANGDVIEFNAERYDYGSNMDIAATYDFTFPATGVYSINACAFVDDLDADEIAFLTVAHTANAWVAQSTMAYGSYTTSRAANSQPPCILAYTGLFNRDEAVRVRFWHTHAAAATLIGGGNNETSFSVSKVE